MNSFKEAFPKNHRPLIEDLEIFWNNGIEILFKDFAEYILQNFDLRLANAVWTEKNGWTYRIGKSGVYLIKGIQIEKAGFIVGGILVKDKKTYNESLEYVRNTYNQQKQEFQKKISQVNERQSQRNKRRIIREREGDFRQCSCGYQYSFREYRRSFRRNNMPTGAAAKTFNTFIVEWSKAKEYSEKIILIDRLLHEFHMSLISGAKHRPVAMNFIDGTRENVDKIINELAGI